MGYLITGEAIEPSTRQVGESVTDAVWLDALQLAGRHGFSGEHLRLESRHESMGVSADDAEALGAALLDGLGRVELLESGHDELDRETVLRIRHVLRHDNVRLSRTPNH